MRPPISLGIAIASLLFALARIPAPAEAEGAGSLVSLDARHFAILRGDRLVIYEIDPARAYSMRALNTVLLDGEGQILGQFRPGEPGVVTPAPARPGSMPKPRVDPGPKPVEEKRLEARSRPSSGARPSRVRVARG